MDANIGFVADIDAIAPRKFRASLLPLPVDLQDAVAGDTKLSCLEVDAHFNCRNEMFLEVKFGDCSKWWYI
jgi:hypothetical protein